MTYILKYASISWRYPITTAKYSGYNPCCMSDRIFDPMQSIRSGWNTFRDNLQFFVILMIIVGVLYNIPGLIFIAAFSLDEEIAQSASPEMLLLIILPMAIVSMIKQTSTESSEAVLYPPKRQHHLKIELYGGPKI